MEFMYVGFVPYQNIIYVCVYVVNCLHSVKYSLLKQEGLRRCHSISIE